MVKKITIIFIIVVVGASLLYYWQTIDDGTYTEDDWASTAYNASKYVEGTKVSTQGIKTETTAKEHWDTIIQEDGEVEKYLVSDAELEKLMNAEIRSQFPKIEDAETELNGIVEFQRHKEGGLVVPLKFVDYDTFMAIKDSNDPGIENVYTLDSRKNLVIAFVRQTTETVTYTDSEIQVSEYTNGLNRDNLVEDGKYQKVTYEINTKTIDYRKIIKKYSLPFQYLWSLIVVTEDKEFALELVDLIDDSQIIVSIYDNVTTTTTTTTYEYEKFNKVDVEATATVTLTNGNSSSQSTEWNPAAEWADGKYEVKKTVEVKENAPLIDVFKADVWFIDYSKSYVEETYPTKTFEKNTKTFTDPVEYVPTSEQMGVEGEQKFSDKLEAFKQSVLEQAQKELDRIVVNTVVDNTVVDNTVVDNTVSNVDGNVVENVVENVIEPVKPTIQSINIDYDAQYYKGNKKISQVEEKEEIKKEYVANPATMVEKVKKKDEQIEETGTWEPNFVTMICEDRHVGARKKLDEKDVDDWLFELLETNPDTKDMVDLTKYLLYKVVGKDKYGIAKYDFSDFESDGFTNVGGTITGGSIQEKVWNALKALDYSDIAVAGAMGNIHYESGSFNPSAIEGGYTEDNGGIGICQWTNNHRGTTGRNAQLRAFATSRGLTWQDEDIQVEFLIGELTLGGGADGYASYQLSNTTELYRSQLACPSAWINAENVGDATEAFCYSFERPKKEAAQSSMAARISYAEQYYNIYARK